MKQVVCDVCGREFAAKTQRRYCPECSHERDLERGRVRRKKAPANVNASIAEIAIAARAVGMTYGQFVAGMEKGE